jgi:hypothetical protein
VARGWSGAPRVSDIQRGPVIDIEGHDSRLIKSAYLDGLVASRDTTVKRAAVARLGYAEGEHKRRAAVSTQHRKQAIASLCVPECGASRIPEGARAWCAWCVENGC